MQTQQPSPKRIQEFISRVLSGEQRAGARLMRLVDDRHPLANTILPQLYRASGRAQIIGITGNPGSGKSTLTDRLITAYRAQGKRVAVVAVDPSSPFSGGAILGDRIRMRDHATDPGVFIRSLATRGHLGGLSRSTNDVVTVLDAMGFDIVLVETVGVGQDEIEVVKIADTSVVVLVPGMGDDIQAIKAGILEIADIFCVNKADRDGVDRTVKDIRGLQLLAGHVAEGTWEVPIVRTVAPRNEGVDRLVTAIETHRVFIHSPGNDVQHARLRAREGHVLRSIARDQLVAALEDAFNNVPGGPDALLERLLQRETDPYSEADLLVRAVIEVLGGKEV